jgi:hypothetical protein
MPREVALVIQSVASLILLTLSALMSGVATGSTAANATPATAPAAASPAPATNPAPAATAPRAATPAPAAGPAAASKPAPSAGAQPDDVPQFEPGMWEYRRTVTSGLKHDAQVVKRCSSPTTDIRQKLAGLSGQGCSMSPPVHHENHYEFRWVCPAAHGVAVFRDRVTFISTASYQDDDEVLHAPQATRTTIVATRLGDCPPTANLHSGHR